MAEIEQAALPAHLQRVHMVGIGGAGMSGLARILLARGGQVSGSDAKDGRGVLALRTRGAVVTIGHDGAALDSLPGGPTVVVSTRAAIPDSNPELVEARRRGIEVVMRPKVLATLMDGYRTLLVAGTHGKTSTTSMAVAALQHCGADPSFAVGGELNESGTNAHHGSGGVFVAEADESDGSLLEYPASVVVITNIEADHLDFFGSPEAYVAVFDDFVAGVVPGGTVIACVDDPGVRALLDRSGAALAQRGVAVWGYGHATQGAEPRPVTEGAEPRPVTEGAEPRPEHVVAELIEFTSGPDGGRSRVRMHPPLVDDELELTLVTPMPGVHMALNALAAVLADYAVLDRAVPLAQLVEGIAEFSGVRRRFEYRGHAAGVRVYDDYAHHPTEVRAVLSAARESADGGRVIAVFQPHLYSRTQEFAAEFGAALDLADVAVVADVFGAREEPTPGVSGRLITERMTGAAHFVPDLSELVPTVVSLVQPGDVVLTLGAGDITMQGPEILAALGERA